MNIIKKSLASLALLATALLCGSCDDRWDNDDVTGTKSQTLWEVISSRSELSEFKNILATSGYDELLQSAGTYTVLAPVNDAVRAIDDATSHLSELPAAHIALLEYNKAALDTMQYLSMYSGKKIALDSMQLTTEEVVCRNGILRFAHYAASTQNNIYEQLLLLADDYKMARFIVELGDSVMDMDKSVQIGLDPNTNLPIYDTVMMFSNPLFDRIPINDNDSLVSLVLLDDETFDALTQKYWPYLKQHNGQNRDASYTTTFKIDSALTTQVAASEVVCDMVCYLQDAAIGAPSYTSTHGIRINMSGANVSRKIALANGNIQIASGVKVPLKNNKIKDVYIQGEDYYYTNDDYIYKRVIPTAMYGYDAVLCGVDTMRSYSAYYLKTDTLADGTLYSHKTDSVVRVTTPSSKYTRYAYNGTTLSKDYPMTNTAKGGSILGYKADLFSCRYRIYWRSVDDRPHHCNPDTLCVDYDKYVENPNYPCGGVIRNIQKLYLSQPGDYELEYNSNQDAGDFVLNMTSNNIFNSTYKNYRCMAGYDPDATADEIGKANNFARLGVNAGVGVGNSLYETPLIWCQTASYNSSNGVYYSGIIGVSVNESYRVNERTGKPIAVPKDQFLCLYNGTATLFVTNAPFNQSVTSTPSYTAPLPFGSIYVDYIHFVPVIEDEDE
jgi:uncharacterized surface protein with fasciclin (FAS1) repeats